MKHVVSFSSGLSSALTALRVRDRYWPYLITPDCPIELVFLDTKFEDEDNYRFMADFSVVTGMPITVLTEGRTPYQVFSEEHIIPNHRTAPCTRRLKIELFRAWLETQEKPITIHIGYDFSEMHRCEPTRKNYEGLGYTVDFPLLWTPIEFRPYEDIFKNDLGIEPPRMYRMGYTHANCGGRCVKQGHGDWLRTLINFPDRYAEIEQWEREMRQNPVNANYAILKDRRGGDMTPLTLEELRKRYETDALTAQMSLFDLDAESACVVCGIGA